MSQLIQIIYAKSPSELTNRKSALGSYIFTLANLLVKGGHQVRLNQWSFDELKQQLDQQDAPSSTGRMIPLPKGIKAGLKDLLLMRSYDRLFQDMKNLSKPDAVLEFYSYGSRVGLELSHNWSCPLYLVYDAPIIEEYEIFHHRKPVFEKKIQRNQIDSLRHAQGIVAYSRPMKAYIRELASLDSDEHIQIHQNVDFSRFDFDQKESFESPYVIGFVGSFLKWHRVDLLVKVFERLRAEDHAIKLLLVGKGMEYEAIRQQVAQSPWKADIDMTGFQDGDDLFRSKQRMHIGVMSSSNWYGAPNKLFEYGAMSLACIAPSTPTIADIFTEEYVGLFENNQEESLYQALSSLLVGKNEVETRGRKMYELIRASYGPEKTLSFYQHMLMNQKLTESL